MLKRTQSFPPLALPEAGRILHDTSIGRSILYLAQVESTMSVAHRLMGTLEEPAGTMIVSDFQTAGRGRRGRAWRAQSGQALLVSVILAEEQLPENLLRLPVIGGLALAEAIRTRPEVNGADIGIKWPNDLVIGPELPPRKLAGLLVESGAAGKRSNYAVLGFGLNVHQSPSELPRPRTGGLEAASLFSITGIHIDRTELLVGLALSLQRTLELEPEAVHRRWDALLVGKQARISVRLGDQKLQGRFVRTAMDGALLMQTEDGEEHRIDSGDVLFHWPQTEIDDAIGHNGCAAHLSPG